MSEELPSDLNSHTRVPRSYMELVLHSAVILCTVSSPWYIIMADGFVSVSGSRTWLLFGVAFPRR